MGKRTWQGLFGLGVAVVALGGASTAQALPASAFVPDGSYVEHRVTPDLDKDGRADLVMIVRTKKLPAFKSTRDRRVIVLRRGPGDSGYLALAEGRKAVLCTGCGGLLWNDGITTVQLLSRNAGFAIRQRFGGSPRVYDQTLTFGLRSGAASGGVVRMTKIEERVEDNLTHAVIKHTYELDTSKHYVTRSSPSVEATTTLDVLTPLYTVGLKNVNYENPTHYAVSYHKFEPK